MVPVEIAISECHRVLGREHDLFTGTQSVENGDLHVKVGRIDRHRLPIRLEAGGGDKRGQETKGDRYNIVAYGPVPFSVVSLFRPLIRCLFRGRAG